MNGIEGAKNYPLSPGSTVALFDAESDIMYIKSMDAGNMTVSNVIVTVTKVG